MLEIYDISPSWCSSTLPAFVNHAPPPPTFIIYIHWLLSLGGEEERHKSTITLADPPMLVSDTKNCEGNHRGEEGCSVGSEVMIFSQEQIIEFVCPRQVSF
uniref:Uncharacterized protein n=1 Tax=Sphaerodactylus townsendi TaxID=933632 RepID=A0ACB8F181_9SAUR